MFFPRRPVAPLLALAAFAAFAAAAAGPTRPARSGEAGPQPIVPGATTPTAGPSPGPAAAPAARRAPAPRWGARGPAAVPGTAPVVTGLRRDAGGRVTGYHVVSPAVVENPFAIFPQGRTETVVSPFAAPAPPAAPPPPPPPAVWREEALALPSSAVCNAREEAALAEKLADPALVRPEVACGEAQFRAEALPLVRSQYRASPKGLVPAVDYEISAAGVVRKRVRSETNAYAQPSDEATLAAFRAGQRFVVSRRRDVRIPCGMCEGARTVATKRLYPPPPAAGTQLLAETCPRCKGAGTVLRHVDALFTLHRSEQP